jgi:methionyl-tRNA synthetase
MPDGATIEQIKTLQALPEEVSIKMKQLNPGAALQAIMSAVYEVGVPETHAFEETNNEADE